ncbi:MAG: hypothetical protein M1832_004546 [Thelocarpon impressellum]|nr:MAG: hypothetical protein M1832_004546 [Thelocarpon impressellum]
MPAPASAAPLKSILKKGTASNSSNTKAERDLETALHHARLLQDRKDAEAQILSAVVHLLDLPSSPKADPVHPSAEDAALLRQLLKPFTPSDYDALIEERNIADLCGYALCPQPPVRQKTGARLRIVDGGRQVVPRRKLEQWCSEACARQALYLRVQLSEEPAWTRAEGQEGELALYDDGKAKTQDTPVQKLTGSVAGLSIADTSAHRLAIERGDMPSTYATPAVPVSIRENPSVFSHTATPPSLPATTSSQDAHLLIEGYEPGSARRSKPPRDGDDDRVASGTGT